MTEIMLITASGLAREALASIRGDRSQKVIGVLDDNVDLHGSDMDGVPIIGPIGAAKRYPDARFLLCAGSSAARRRLVDQLAGLGITAEKYATLIDPSVTVPASCTVGTGSILLANVILTTSVTIGRHVVVMPRVSLAHDDVLDDFATLASGAALGGQVRVGRGAYLGMNSSIRRGSRIGSGASVGMGAAVLSDIPSGEKWLGVPAARAAAPERAKVPAERDKLSTTLSAFERLSLSAALLNKRAAV